MRISADNKIAVLIGSDFGREWVDHYGARPLIIPKDCYAGAEPRPQEGR
jgi:hypothetical protein